MLSQGVVMTSSNHCPLVCPAASRFAIAARASLKAAITRHIAKLPAPTTAPGLADRRSRDLLSATLLGD